MFEMLLDRCVSLEERTDYDMSLLPSAARICTTTSIVDSRETIPAFTSTEYMHQPHHTC